MPKKLKLQRGDEIQITLKGRNYTGTVRTACNYGTEEDPDWYIEFDGLFGYTYWKQKIDGGSVTKL